MKTRIFLTGLVLATWLALCPAPGHTVTPWPGVTFTFDDGYASLNLARPVFKQYNVVATSFPIAGWIGQSGQATWSDLSGLLADGWEIGSHTMTHVNLTTVSDSQLDYELSMSKQLLETTLHTSVYALALPGGAGYDNPRVLSACAKYYHFVRNVVYPWQYNHLPPSPYHIGCMEAYSNTAVSDIIQWIETARSQGYWPVVTFHGIVSGTANPNDPEQQYSYGTDQLAQVLQYVTAHGYPTPTVTGVFKQFPPVANAGSSQTVNLGATVTLDGSGSSDPCAQTPLSFAWSFKSKPAGSKASLTGANTVHPIFTVDVAGSYLVQLVVTNNLKVASKAATATISTSTINLPPVAIAGPAQTVHQGNTVILDGSASYDPNGDPITFAWSFTSKPTGSSATLSSSTVVNPAFMADKAGNYVVRLIVTDSHGAASAPSSVTISTKNSAPVANAGPAQTVPPGAIVTLDGSHSSDPDGDPITYAWSFTSKPAGSTAVLNGSAFVNPNFMADKAGNYVVQLIVTDKWGATSTPATVTITAGNSTPVVIDSYPETNLNDWGELDANMRGWGQAFTGDGSSATSAKFYLLKSGSPTGSAYAKIYAISGTFGSNAKPTGAALATSAPISVPTIPTSWNLVEFTFPTPFQTTNGTHYIITIEYTGGTSSNVIIVGGDSSSPTHAGNSSYNWTGAWNNLSGYDLCFYVLGVR